MKITIRLAILAGLFAAGATQLLAQGTALHSWDMRAIMAPNATIARNIDTLTRSVDIGKPGLTANAWRFDSLASSAALGLVGKAATGTPYAAEFPFAKTALQMQSAISILYQGFPLPITLQNVYFYSAISDTAYQDMGFRGTSPLAPDAILRWKFAPADTAYVFPVVYGGKWTSTFRETLYVFGTTILGVINLTTARNHVDTSWVDAYGSMTMPDKTTHDALRIRTVDHITTFNTSGVPSYSAAVYYTFVGPDGVRVKLTARDTTQPDNGRILITLNHDFVHDIQWNPSNIVTDVPLAPAAVPSEFTLQQNYPNPFNPTTSIRYSVPARSMVTLAVYNLLGQQVAQLVSGDREKGNYEVRFNASALPSGTYFYRLAAGSFVETRRMMLVK